MKILILGADGMLGHKLFQILRTVYSETYGTISGKVTGFPLKQISWLQTDKLISEVKAMNFQHLKSIIKDASTG